MGRASKPWARAGMIIEIPSFSEYVLCLPFQDRASSEYEWAFEHHLFIKMYMIHRKNAKKFFFKAIILLFLMDTFCKCKSLGTLWVLNPSTSEYKHLLRLQNTSQRRPSKTSSIKRALSEHVLRPIPTNNGEHFPPGFFPAWGNWDFGKSKLFFLEIAVWTASQISLLHT